MRGCEYTHGFPLPVSCFQVLPGQTKIADILNCLKNSPWELALLAMDILICLFMAEFFIKKCREIRWAGAFQNALAINLSIIWSYLCIYLMNIENLKSRFFDNILQAYTKFCLAYLIFDIPDYITSKLIRIIPHKIPPGTAVYEDPLRDTLLDITTRVWLITATALLATLLYWIFKRRQKRHPA